MDYLVSEQKINDLVALAPTKQKTVVLISGDWEDRHAVASIVIDDLLSLAEVHQQARDVWYILSGQGSFILGGELVEPNSPKPNEFLGQGIIGGSVTAVKSGDVIDIPPGVPHQIDARGNRLNMLIVKVRYDK